MNEFTALRAVILAAGSGSRMVPVTLDTPRPLVRVKGVRIIDTLIDALQEAGIEDITVVRGYRKEQFDELLEKYPSLRFVDNDLYATTGNISSVRAALDSVRGGCYICESDLLIRHPEVIRRYHASSDYLCSYTRETEDWCLQEVGGRAVNYRKGNVECFSCFGISFWTPEDCDKLRTDIEELWNEAGGRDLSFGQVPLDVRKDDYDVKIHECQKGDVVKVDSYHDLLSLDSSYKGYQAKNK